MAFCTILWRSVRLYVCLCLLRRGGERKGRGRGREEEERDSNWMTIHRCCLRGPLISYFRFVFAISLDLICVWEQWYMFELLMYIRSLFCLLRSGCTWRAELVIVFTFFWIYHFFQVLGGKARRKKLLSPKGMDVRPMMEVVKGAAFAILQVSLGWIHYQIKLWCLPLDFMEQHLLYLCFLHWTCSLISAGCWWISCFFKTRALVRSVQWHRFSGYWSN